MSAPPAEDADDSESIFSDDRGGIVAGRPISPIVDQVDFLGSDETFDLQGFDVTSVRRGGKASAYQRELNVEAHRAPKSVRVVTPETNVVGMGGQKAARSGRISGVLRSSANSTARFRNCRIPRSPVNTL